MRQIQTLKHNIFIEENIEKSKVLSFLVFGLVWILSILITFVLLTVTLFLFFFNGRDEVWEYVFNHIVYVPPIVLLGLSYLLYRKFKNAVLALSFIIIYGMIFALVVVFFWLK